MRNNMIKKIIKHLLVGGTFFFLLPAPTYASVEPFLGEIIIMPYGFCPRSWVAADGRSLPISSNAALFSLLGTTFGGDGRTFFKVPDLRGRVAVGIGDSGHGTFTNGQRGGASTTTLGMANMPSHTHGATTTSTLRASDASGTSPDPEGKVLADDGNDKIYNTENPNVAMSKSAVVSDTVISYTGESRPITNMQPFLGLRFCIATQGVFPTRN